jgi:hypothetical protein
MALSTIDVGNKGEVFVSRLFRKAGFKVTRAPKSRGVFDIVAVKGEVRYAIQVKNNEFRNRSKPFRFLTILNTDPQPENTIRLWWHRAYRNNINDIFVVTPDGFTELKYENLLTTLES